MITGQSAAYTAMINSASHVIAARAQITLPGGVLTVSDEATLTKVNIQAQTTTDAPDQTRLQFGLPNIQPTFSIAGTVSYLGVTYNIADLFGKYATGSPLFRGYVEQSPVTIDLGMIPVGAGSTPEWVRKFTGLIDSYVENDDGTIDFVCIDNHGLMRGTVSTPSVISAPPWNSGLTSEFVIDAVARAGSGTTVSSWPAQRASCLLAAGMRSSIWPEVGTLNITNSQPGQSFTPGAFGSALTNLTVSAGDWAAVAYTLAAPAATHLFIEFRGAVGTGIDATEVLISTLDETDGISLYISQAQVMVSSQSGGSFAITPTVGTADHYVAVALTLPAAGGTAVAGTLYFDGTATPFTLTLSTARTAVAWQSAFVLVSADAMIEAVQVSAEVAPVSNFGFVPKAVLDPSLNKLSVIPAVSGDASAIFQQIAEAELGVIGWDELGILRFYNRRTIASRTSVKSVTSQTSLEAIGISGAAASVVNRCQIPYTPWSFGTVASTVYSAVTVIKVPAGQTTVPIIAALSVEATAIGTAVTNLPNGSVDVTVSHFRASTSAAGLTEHPGGLVWTVTQTGLQTVSISIKNTSRVDAYLVSPANYSDILVGTPVLTIAGIVVTAGDSLTADYQYPWITSMGTNGRTGAAGTVWGEVPYAATDNGWVQDAATANTLCVDVVGDGFVPRPDLTGVQILPDPRLQTTDRVLITETDAGTNVNAYATIFGWEIDYDATAQPPMTMSIDARTVQAPGRSICGDPVLDLCGSANDY